MKRILKQRLEAYKGLIIGLIFGFIVISYLFEPISFKSALIALGFALVVGELILYPRWRKQEARKKQMK